MTKGDASPCSSTHLETKQLGGQNLGPNILTIQYINTFWGFYW